MTQKGTEWTGNVLGRPLLHGEFLDPLYYLRHLRLFAAKIPWYFLCPMEESLGWVVMTDKRETSFIISAVASCPDRRIASGIFRVAFTDG